MLLTDDIGRVQRGPRGRPKSGDASADEATAAPDPWPRSRDLQQQIQLQLSTSGLRPQKGVDHALVLETIAEADIEHGAGADVNSIYKALCDRGEALFMSKLYRTIKTLEQVGLLERSWEGKHGRVRSVYRVKGLTRPSQPCSRLVCRTCGAATLSSSAALGREIAEAARQGGLPIGNDAVVVYVQCEPCSTGMLEKDDEGGRPTHR